MAFTDQLIKGCDDQKIVMFAEPQAMPPNNPYK
jgi:hypothetical protein